MILARFLLRLSEAHLTLRLSLTLPGKKLKFPDIIVYVCTVLYLI